MTDLEDELSRFEREMLSLTRPEETSTDNTTNGTADKQTPTSNGATKNNNSASPPTQQKPFPSKPIAQFKSQNRMTPPPRPPFMQQHPPRPPHHPLHMQQQQQQRPSPPRMLPPPRPPLPDHSLNSNQFQNRPMQSSSQLPPPPPPPSEPPSGGTWHVPGSSLIRPAMPAFPVKSEPEPKIEKPPSPKQSTYSSGPVISMLPHTVSSAKRRAAAASSAKDDVADAAVVVKKPALTTAPITPATTQASETTNRVHVKSMPGLTAGQRNVDAMLATIANDREKLAKKNAMAKLAKDNSNAEFAPVVGKSGNVQTKEKKKQKKFMRTAAGETWEDQTLGEWDQDDYRIFVGDLGNEVTDDTLVRAFNKYPSFVKARVIRDKKSQKTKGYGFASFSDPMDFARAMREMNGRYVGNRPVKLKKSCWRERQTDCVKKKEREKKKLGFR